MIRIEQGDSREVLRGIADGSIDSCVTDPPYALVSIVKRFGKPGSAPCQEGTDGAYRRASSGFMGKVWDTGETAFDPAFWSEVLRVLRPGAHLLAFGGTRSYHRLACAIEDAGFEIRDQIGWLYGSGFPKSHDVSKGIDKAAGAEREKIRHAPRPETSGTMAGASDTGPWIERSREVGFHEVDGPEPATEAARQWQGWGTALKPAWEPIVLARKPLISTVAANVLRWGTGALNIDGCRIISSTGQRLNGEVKWGDGLSLCSSCAALADSQTKPITQGTRESIAISSAGPTSSAKEEMSLPVTGRTATGCSDGMKTDTIGTSLSTGECGKKPTAEQSRPDTKSITTMKIVETTDPIICSSCGNPITSLTTSENTTAEKKNSRPGESSSAPVGREGESSAHRRYAGQGSTNFAATPGPRGGAPEGRWPANLIHDGSDEVLEAFARFSAPGQLAASIEDGEPQGNSVYGAMKRGGPHHVPRVENSTSPARFFYQAKASKKDRCDSKHPTVKPIALLRYLCRLITPPGGTVLDPFAGSGTTGEAAHLEGFTAILIEREAEYVEDIKRRIAGLTTTTPPEQMDLLTAA